MEAVADINWLGLISIIVLVAILGGVLYFNVLKPEQEEATDYTQLAKRRDWRVERQMASLGKGYRVEVGPSEGQLWSCKVTRYFNMPTTVMTTEFRTLGAFVSAGMVVIGPALPAAEVAMAELMLGGQTGLIGRLLLQGVTDSDVAGHLSGLRRVEQASLAGASVFATDAADPTHIVQALAPPLQRWISTNRDEKAFPILIVTSNSLILRMRMEAGPAQLEAFIDMAFAVAQGIRQ